MKNKHIIFTVMLVLALVSAACTVQDATNEPGEASVQPTASTDGSAATAGAGEAAMTPTISADGGTPAQGAGDAGTTPTVSADDGTPAQGAGDAGTTPTVSAGGGTPVQGTGGTAVIPQTGFGDAGLPDDLDEVIIVLRETGATVDLGDTVALGDFVEQDVVSVAGQTILINGEEVQVFAYDSTEELEAQASQLIDERGPESEPPFYKLGTMLVRYVGYHPDVRDLLEDVLGARAVGE